jgi:hypothetical protein
MRLGTKAMERGEWRKICEVDKDLQELEPRRSSSITTDADR